jgi:hypothetical protein
MSKANILVYLNIYRDSNPTNSPNMSHTKWQRELQGVSAEKPQSIEFSLAPGESRVMFDGQRTLSSDNTTVYSLTLKSGSTYMLKNTSGTSPAFRTLRNIGSDATSQITVTVSGSLMTLQGTGGTIISTASVVVGDEISIGNIFNAANRGRFKILSKTTNSVTVENSSAIAEASITLGSNYADEIRIYSASGVQKGDKIKLGSGFFSTNQSTYEVTGVQDNLVEFFSAGVLATETGLVNPSVTIYSSAKKLVYVETDKPVNVTVNGIAESKIEPFIEGNNSLPGMLLKRSTMWEMTITNNGTDMATLYFVSIE